MEEQQDTTQQVVQTTMLGFMSNDEVLEDDPFTNKIGGHPAWLGDTVPAEELKCKSCGSTLVLLIQASAPLPQLSDLDRVIYIFACMNRKCGSAENGEAKSWKAIRMQKKVPQDETKESKGESNKMNTDSSDDWGGVSDWGAKKEPEKPKKVDSWGAGADDWGAGGGWTSNVEVDFEKMLAQKEEAATQKNQPQQGKKKKDNNNNTSQQQQRHNRGKDAPYYMPYYMDIEEEEGSEVLVSQRVKELAEIHKEEAVGGSAEWIEEYERQGDKKFMRFQETIQRNPDQVLRYSFGGMPLWMSAIQPPKVPPCEHCGQERVFEMQVLSTLIYFLEEKQMRRQKNNKRGKKKGKAVQQQPQQQQQQQQQKEKEEEQKEENEQGLEFGSMMLYVCKNSCGEEGKAYSEYVYIQPAL